MRNEKVVVYSKALSPHSLRRIEENYGTSARTTVDAKIDVRNGAPPRIRTVKSNLFMRIGLSVIYK